MEFLFTWCGLFVAYLLKVTVLSCFGHSPLHSDVARMLPSNKLLSAVDPITWNGLPQDLRLPPRTNSSAFYLSLNTVHVSRGWMSGFLEVVQYQSLTYRLKHNIWRSAQSPESFHSLLKALSNTPSIALRRLTKESALYCESAFNHFALLSAIIQLLVYFHQILMPFPQQLNWSLNPISFQTNHECTFCVTYCVLW